MGSRPTITYQPALDGVRAVAVLAVLAFHAEVPGFSGGYLGVSVFFTLSGFLITTLLVSEAESTGRVSAGAFYARRARRLLPASVLCVALIVVLAAVTDLFAGVADLRAHVVGLVVAGRELGVPVRRRLVPTVVPAGRRAPPRRSSTTGRWRSRSSSTGCGRSRSSPSRASRGPRRAQTLGARRGHGGVRGLVTRDRRGVGWRCRVLGHAGACCRDPDRWRAGVGRCTGGRCRGDGRSRRQWRSSRSRSRSRRSRRPAARRTRARSRSSPSAVPRCCSGCRSTGPCARRCRSARWCGWGRSATACTSTTGRCTSSSPSAAPTSTARR